MRICTLSLFALSITAGCGAEEPRRADEPIASPGSGPAYSVAHPDQEADRRAADFRGSCAFARPPGDPAQYTLLLRARESALGTIRVRSKAEFVAGDRRELLGEVPSGTILRGAGPLRSGAGEGGVGYAVVVRDGAGRVCRGYVSDLQVERVQNEGSRQVGAESRPR